MPDSLITVAWVALALISVGAGLCIFAHHIPALRALVDGLPAQPYTDRTETDTTWLAELPALHTEE